jgi:DDE superfamily endonuclease
LAHPTESSDHPSWLSKAEFKQKYRMDRDSFDNLLEKLNDHPVFKNNTSRRGRKQATVPHQLMVFLKIIGTQGDGASNYGQRNTFCIGYGSNPLICNRVVQAIISLEKEYLTWPDADERKVIAKAFQLINGFPRCVSIVDGTLLPLAFAPQTPDAGDYSGRKHAFSLSVLIFNDHKRRIRHYHSGFPGSAHDNRIWTNTLLHQKQGDYFSPNEYILGDSAFASSAIMVPCYKIPSGHEIKKQHESFNTKAAAIRTTSEHTIGILKSRFPGLRDIRMPITEKKESLRKILMFIHASIILHNMLIEFKDEIDKKWEEDNDDDDEEGDSPPVTGDEEMRTSILQHLIDTFVITS